MMFVILALGQLLMMGRDLSDIRRVVAVMILMVGIGFEVDALSVVPSSATFAANGG